MRIDHLARLADCLGLDGDEAAQERYDEVLRLAEQLGDVERQLLILNNRAYCATMAGRFDLALTWSARLQTLSQDRGIALHLGRLDTVARALMGLGRLERGGGGAHRRGCDPRRTRPRSTATPVPTSC